MVSFVFRFQRARTARSACRLHLTASWEANSFAISPSLDVAIAYGARSRNSLNPLSISMQGSERRLFFDGTLSGESVFHRKIRWMTGHADHGCPSGVV